MYYYDIFRMNCDVLHFYQTLSFTGFPDELTIRQKYMLLGNSLNVHMVTVLLQILTDSDM